jgi:hypothetical protein
MHQSLVVTVTPENVVLLHIFIKEYLLRYQAVLYSLFHLLAMFAICFDTLKCLHASSILNLFNVHSLKTNLTFQNSAGPRNSMRLEVFLKVVE